MELVALDDDVAAAVDVEPDEEFTAMEDLLQFPWQLQWQVIWCRECSAQITSFFITNSLNSVLDPVTESRCYNQYIIWNSKNKNRNK